MSSPKAHSYQKGDNQAGGGGGRGGGGKRTRPQAGSDKDDVARGVAQARPDAELPRKPGPEVPGPEPGASSSEAERDLPVLQSLQRQNAKLLTSLDKLENSGRPEERAALLEDVDEELCVKRSIESRLFPLLDDADDVAVEVERIRAMDRDIDRDLSNLRSREPDDRTFVIGVEVLHGDLERQIERESAVLIPAWSSLMGPAQARNLDRRGSTA